MKVKGLLKGFRHGEKGFTLIELLVVVAILGVLAAVVIPNVMGIMGTGRVEAANTEAHDVEVAVLSAMVDNNVYELTAGGTVGPAEGGGNTDTIDEIDVAGYLNRELQATYTLDANGHITAATPADGGKWDGLTYNADTGWSE